MQVFPQYLGPPSLPLGPGVGLDRGGRRGAPRPGASARARCSFASQWPAPPAQRAGRGGAAGGEGGARGGGGVGAEPARGREPGQGQPSSAERRRRRRRRPAWAMGARSATVAPRAGSHAAGAARTAAEPRPGAPMPAAAAQTTGPGPPAPRAPGRAAPTATGSRGSGRPTTAAASWCEVRGPLAALGHWAPPFPDGGVRSPHAYIRPVVPLGRTWYFECLLCAGHGQAGKGQSGGRDGRGGGGRVGLRPALLRAGAENSVPAHPGENGRDAAPSRGARTGPGSARDRGAAGPPPSPVSRPQRRRPPCSSRERHQDLGGEQLAALARLSTFSWLPLPDGAWAQPLSVRPFAGRICPCLPRPSPSALLSRPFLPAELAFSALFLQAPPDCTRVPSAL